jgi:CRISPR system Cascade subunit CasC
MNKSYKNLYVEFHILQSFPVTCLNRDDVGSPKSAIIGGVERARVSSQCWKRAIRMQLHDNGTKIASRTKLFCQKIAKDCEEYGATEDQIKECSTLAANIYTNKIDEKGVSDVLAFISDNESKAIAKYFKDLEFDSKKFSDKDLKKLIKSNTCTAVDGLDIGLFGRMVAKQPELNIYAAASVAHAISTHKVVSEIDFFTAIDDIKDNQGAGFVGSLEFNSATYYRYVSLNIGQLAETLDSVDLDKAIEAFIKALYLAIPEARQSTQSGSCFWDFARIYVRHGQRLQAQFENAIKKNSNGYLEPSKIELCKYLDKTGATICGGGAIQILLAVLELVDKESKTAAELVYYTTSGNLTTNYSQCVSYAGITFFDQEPEA